MTFIEITPCFINEPDQPKKMIVNAEIMFFFKMENDACRVGFVNSEQGFLIKETYSHVKQTLGL